MGRQPPGVARHHLCPRPQGPSGGNHPPVTRAGMRPTRASRPRPRPASAGAGERRSSPTDRGQTRPSALDRLPPIAQAIDRRRLQSRRPAPSRRSSRHDPPGCRRVCRRPAVRSPTVLPMVAARICPATGLWPESGSGPDRQRRWRTRGRGYVRHPALGRRCHLGDDCGARWSSRSMRLDGRGQSHSVATVLHI